MFTIKTDDLVREPVVIVTRNRQTGKIECAFLSKCPTAWSARVDILGEARQATIDEGVRRSPQKLELDLAKVLHDGGVR